jgi:hypothetical protein
MELKGPSASLLQLGIVGLDWLPLFCLFWLLYLRLYWYIGWSNVLRFIFLPRYSNRQIALFVGYNFSLFDYWHGSFNIWFSTEVFVGNPMEVTDVIKWLMTWKDRASQSRLAIEKVGDILLFTISHICGEAQRGHGKTIKIYCFPYYSSSPFCCSICPCSGGALCSSFTLIPSPCCLSHSQPSSRNNGWA